MASTSLRQLAVYAALLVALASLGSRWLERDPPAPKAGAAAAPIELDGDDRGRVTVHVAGAVRRPGVYRLPGSARVHDAVERAGGASGRADLTQVNLAARLEDGRQVLLPERAPPPDSAAAAAGAADTASPAVPLNLNTATLEQLDALDGIGPATAQQILDFRQANNGFGSVEELGEVPGIGDKRLASLREQVRV